MKDAIADKAEELIFQEGLISITMDRLASEMGISKKTIYIHFSSKEDLVDFLIMRRLDLMQHQINQVMKTHDNVIHVFVRIMEIMPELIKSVNPGIFDELKKKYRATWKRFEDFKNKHMAQCLMELLEKGKRQGYFRKNIQSEIVVRMRIYQMMSTMNSKAYPFHQFTFQQIHQQLLEHFLYGICTYKGFELLEKLKKDLDS